MEGTSAIGDELPPFLVALLGYGHDATTLHRVSGMPLRLIYMLPKYLIGTAGTIKLEPLKRPKNGTEIARLSFRLTETLARQAVNIPETMQNPEV